eukprot:395315-Pyramimonas_sp.AAC.1
MWCELYTVQATECKLCGVSHAVQATWCKLRGLGCAVQSICGVSCGPTAWLKLRGASRVA